MKKIEVYVVVDTPKKAKKLKRVLDMFGEKVYEDSVWHNDGYPYYSIDYDREYWVGDSLKDSEDLKNKIEVSIKELRNILAKEHLKEGDVALFEDKGYKVLGRYKKYSDVFKDFVCDKIEGNSSTTTGFHNFIRYATEEEKALLEPKKELEVGKWYAFSWDDRPNDVRGVYLIDKVENDKVWFKYGINVEDNTWSYRDWYSKSHNWRLATAKEVEQGLINESKIRGYEYTEYDYNPEENELCGTNNGRLESVFCDGHWEEPASNFTDSDIAIVERLHDTLLDNHGYSLGSKLLTDARMLANKIKSNIK